MNQLHRGFRAVFITQQSHCMLFYLHTLLSDYLKPTSTLLVQPKTWFIALHLLHSQVRSSLSQFSHQALNLSLHTVDKFWEQTQSDATFALRGQNLISLSTPQTRAYINHGCNTHFSESKMKHAVLQFRHGKAIQMVSSASLVSSFLCEFNFSCG